MRRLTALFAFALAFSSATPAFAATTTRTAERAKEWATAHGLPTRTVEAGPEGKKVTRLFVPLKPEHWADFLQTFNPDTGSLVFKFSDKGASGNVDNHMALMGNQPTEAYLWGRKIDPSWINQHGYGNGSLPGQAIVVELSPEESAHVKQWLTQRADGNDWYFRNGGGSACMDFIGNLEVKPGADGTNTLHTIDQATARNSMGVPTGEKLFAVLGLRRSKDGRVMKAKMLHAGNARIEVVGYPVGGAAPAGPARQQWVIMNGRRVLQNVPAAPAVAAGDPIARFNALTDAELLGPPPPQGLAAAVKQ